MGYLLDSGDHNLIVCSPVEDYPRTVAELEARFHSEQACREYLFPLRWPGGFRCPRCGSGKAWRVRSGLWQCAGCGRQTSVTAGTIFQDTHTRLTAWFPAMWWMTTPKNGVSALGLQRVLGLGSYQTAWAWLHKLRRAMVRPGRDRLAGEVEVDEAYVGGREGGKRGRQAGKKALIVVAAQEAGQGTGGIRMRRIADASAANLLPFVQDSIEPGSIVHTDAGVGYESLGWSGYRHGTSPHRKAEKSPSDLLPRVHRVIALLKQWLLGTHQGAVRFDHLDYYLDEFTFRFNRRRSRSRGKLFFRLLQQAVAVEPATYASIIRTAPAKPQDIGGT